MTIDKASYFMIEIPLEPFFETISNINDKIENSVDMILVGMSASDNVYKFKTNSKIIYLFSTLNRKRKGQLDKLVEKHLVTKELITTYFTRCMLKIEFHQNIQSLKKERGYQLVDEPLVFSGYKGNDIKFLETTSTWHPWQLELHKELYYPTGEIRPSDDRKIIFLYDPIGNVGKSMWIKFLYTKNPEAIAKVSFGSAAQLRSCLINMGNSKKIYFIDLPRSKEKYASDSDLLNAIEDLKNGFISSPMYGKDSSMLIEPPHIVVSSNYIFGDDGLSKDRWKIYQIGKDKNLIDITKEIMRQQLGNKIGKKYEAV